MNKAIIIIIILSFLPERLSAQTKNGFDLSNTSIPSSEIKSGGPPKDGIPALDKPLMIPAADADYLLPDDRVIGIEVNGESRAYPIKILNYHEIVNDIIGDKPLVVSYCPLCGSALVFNALVNNQKLSFGVSGLLYNSDVLMYDQETNSLWSQLMMEAVSGKMLGRRIDFISSEHTTWRDWRQEHPDTKVLSNNTGHSRNYNRSPYSGYEDVATLYFPVTNRDDKIFAKEQVLGISVNDKFKAYPFSELEKENKPITDTVGGSSFIITYDAINKSAVVDSNSGNIVSITLFWFAWYAFHPETEVYKSDKN